jgi:hypothetical protein
MAIPGLYVPIAAEDHILENLDVVINHHVESKKAG